MRFDEYRNLDGVALAKLVADGEVTAAELLENEQLWDRGFYQEVDDADSGLKMVYPGAPYKMSESGWRPSKVAPRVGQHNKQVYCEELGLSHEELQELTEAGVL